MRKIVLFFIGVLILVMAFVAMAAAGAIFDTARQIRIESYFFQPNNLSSGRLGVPVTIAELGETKMRQRLVQRYISEYFYVIPDSADVARRMQNSKTSPLSMMSTPQVFKDWVNGEGKAIEQMAQENVFRTARVVGDIIKPAGSDYWTVVCELVTWRRSNDMSQVPEVSQLILYMGLEDANMMDFRETIDVADWLEHGDEPAAIFRFGVNYIDIGRK